MWHSRPPREPPPFMANAILNFHFDYLNPSLIKVEAGNEYDCTWNVKKRQKNSYWFRQIVVDSDYALITCNPLRCGSDKRQTRVYSDFTQTIWWGLWLISNIKWWLITKTHIKWFSVYFEIWSFVWPSIILVLHLQQSWAFYILRGLLSSDQLRSTFNIHILHFCCSIIGKNESIIFLFSTQDTKSDIIYSEALFVPIHRGSNNNSIKNSWAPNFLAILEKTSLHRIALVYLHFHCTKLPYIAL